ncbi:hypothetical protein RQP46_011428 [Phenoliferia psychrophenolica]
MFFNSEMLTKRGPLARVWMASHLSTKIPKAQLLSTSIPTSVTSILGQDLLPMALRLSGQLLLGVARIYSRKAKYLLDDCNETLAKVKKAFGREGQVDLEEGAGGRDAINLRAEKGGLDDILGYNDGEWGMDFNAAPAGADAAANKKGKGKASLAGAAADIDLPPQAHEFDLLGGYGDLDDDEPMYDLGPDGALVFDLGLDDLDDVDGSEVGRGNGDRKRSASAMEDEDVEIGRREDRQSSAAFSGVDMNNDFGGGGDDFGGAGDKEGEEGLDFGLDGDMGGHDDFDFGDFGGAGERERTPQQDDPAPAANGDLDAQAAELTPKAAAANLAAKKDKASANKKQKLRKQQVDRVTELDWKDGGKAALEAKKELLFTEPSYLPRSRTHLRLMERAQDPSYYLPKPLDDTANTSYLFAPPGLAPQLQQLFKFTSRRSLLKLQNRERSPDDVPQVELGLREPSPMDFGDMNNDFGGGGGDDYNTGGEDGGMLLDDEAGDNAFGEDMDMGGHEDFQFDIPNEEDEALAVAQKAAAAKERLQAHNAAERLQDEFVATGALAIFDQAGSSATQTQTQTQSNTQQGEGDDDDDRERAKGAWSKNTMKAVAVLRTELEAEDDFVEFKTLAKVEEASQRAVASFFFELLVLSTRDCIDVKQAEAYGPIEITAKAKLFTDVIVDNEALAA